VRSHGTVVLALSRGVHLVVVPRVSGDTVPTATAALAQLTLTVSGTRPQYSATVARGLVIGTLPAAGQTIRHGSGVELLISQGPAPIKVPTVVNMPVAAATRELSSAGFKVIEAPQQVYSNQIPAGNVAAQTPNGGALAARGSTVTITVSQGPQLFPVPNEVGRNVSSAVRDLQRHGFIPAVQQLAGGNGQQVVAQNPQGGTQIPQGSTVTLYTF
jgi:serine/threonine-protein kinase